jgi:hypothetical protein
VRQYSEGGWIGVEKESNGAWYGEQLTEAFGVAGLALGLLGLPALRAGERRRALLVAVFPLLYGAVLLAMSMVVKRNLLPFLPPAAALLGVGVAALVRFAGARLPRARLAVAAALCTAAVATPLVAVVEQDLRLSLPGTRALATDWIRDHLPPGAGIVKESYTPRLEGDFDVLQTRFAARVEPEDLWSGRYDYVLLADAAYGRFLDPANLQKEHQRIYAERYRQLLSLPEAFTVDGGALRLGPGLSLRVLAAPDAPAVYERRFSAADASYLAGVERESAGTLRFTGPGQWAMFKDRFAAGRYAVTVSTPRPGAAAVRILDVAGVEVLPAQPPPLDLSLTAPGKLFVYVTLPAGDPLSGVVVTLRR